MIIVPAGEPIGATLPMPRGALPDTRIGHGSHDIARAWLTAPSRRLSHGVLGDAIEATAVNALDRNGNEFHYELPEDSAFEDLLPRVHDLDGDGLDEILLVRSRQQTGSSLMVLGIREGKLIPVAESPPSSRANSGSIRSAWPTSMEMANRRFLRCIPRTPMAC